MKYEVSSITWYIFNNIIEKKEKYICKHFLIKRIFFYKKKLGLSICNFWAKILDYLYSIDLSIYI